MASDANPNSAHLRLWQLISPALPVGAYAYSQGMEYAVHAGWIKDERDAVEWIEGLAINTVTTLDVPVLARLYDGWLNRNEANIDYWNQFLLAARESAELRAEDSCLGGSLARLLAELEVVEAVLWRDSKQTSFATMFALATTRWDICLEDAAQGYLWAWSENQVAAAVKLVPLGQSAGQRILSRIIDVIPGAVATGLQLDDDAIGVIAPGLAIASALHETQYTRLFRS